MELIGWYTELLKQPSQALDDRTHIVSQGIGQNALDCQSWSCRFPILQSLRPADLPGARARLRRSTFHSVISLKNIVPIRPQFRHLCSDEQIAQRVSLVG